MKFMNFALLQTSSAKASPSTLLSMSDPGAPLALYGCIADVAIQTPAGAVALGKKGLAICTTAGAAKSLAALHLVLFHAQTRRPEFSTPLSVDFALALAEEDDGVWFDATPTPIESKSSKAGAATKPSGPVPLHATFSKRDEQDEFCRAILLAKDQIQEEAYKSAGGSRSLLYQDIVGGAVDSRALEVGDSVKIKYSVFPCQSVPPNGAHQVGKKLITVGSDDALRVQLGGGKPLDSLAILEQAISGMRKRGRRLITIPSHLWSHEAPALPWAAALTANCTLFVELSVQSVKFHNRTAETPAEEKSTAQSAPPAPPAPVEPEPQPVSRKSKKVVERPASPPESPVKHREPVTIPTVAHIQSTVATTAAAPADPAAPLTRDSRFDELSAYLANLQLSDYTPTFVAQDIQFTDLKLLSESELVELVPKLGPRRRLMASLAGATPAAAVTSVSAHRIPEPIKTVESPPPPAVRPKAAVVVEAVDESESLRGLQSLPREKALAFARSEYERGREEMLQQCRDQFTQIKSSASDRINSLEHELAQRDAEVAELHRSIADAKSVFQSMRAQLAESEQQQQKLLADSREWASRVRNNSAEQASTLLREAMDQVFEQLCTLIAADQIYDGTMVLRHIKSKLKTVAQSVLQTAK